MVENSFISITSKELDMYMLEHDVKDYLLLVIRRHFVQ
jgi:hypothetical protein